MVKICAVGDCKGGSAADKSERQLRGVRQLALFKVPKSQEDLKRWADLLGTPLNGNSVVCEQHFSKDDVRTEDSFILEGCRAVLPRLRCSLQRGALPLSRIIDDQTSSAEDSAVVTDDPVSCPDDAAPTVVNEVVGMTIQRFTTALIETPLPPTWCWFQSNEKIVFTQIDQFTSKIKLFVDIQPDLSIIIRSPDNREKVDLGRKAETVACVFDIIKSCKACNGTGVKPESRSENCRFLISKEDYQRPVAVPRCLYCRKLRIKILKKRLRSATNIKVRYARCQREVYHQQRQYKRLLKKEHESFWQQVSLLTKCYPGASPVEVRHCVTVAEGDMVKAAQLVSHRQEADQSITSNLTFTQIEMENMNPRGKRRKSCNAWSDRTGTADPAQIGYRLVSSQRHATAS